MKNLYVGLMSGTSLDGIDAALVETDGQDTRLLHTHYHEYDTPTRHLLKKLASAASCQPGDIGRADAMLGSLFADCVNDLLARYQVPAQTISAIGSHGQTIAHAPTGNLGFTLQIGDPNRIAALTGITTVADFRRMDIAYGGQGAPLVPLFHQAAFGAMGRSQAIINIGGISNVSLLPGNSRHARLLGFDTGPGNTLMNEWIQINRGKDYDHNGDWAQEGTVDSILLQHMLDDPYFAAPPPKSTGTDYFSLDWLKKMISRLTHAPTAENVQATLCALTATSIKGAVLSHMPEPDRVLLCGGGARNKTLRHLIQQQFSCNVDISDSCGIPAEWVEACAFAWLADQRLRGIAINTPQITGASRPCLLGAVYLS
ncbi:MAG: hypothetical protein RIQ52_73 [Pseudomonadota bacterium]